MESYFNERTSTTFSQERIEIVRKFLVGEDEVLFGFDFVSNRGIHAEVSLSRERNGRRTT